LRRRGSPHRRHLEQDRQISVPGHPRREQQDGRRLVSRHGSAIAFVPYFARYAYETYVAPHSERPDDCGSERTRRRDLATVLRDVVIRFDNLWRMPFPYVMALHQAPVQGETTGSTSISSSTRRSAARTC
jgi:UDPglucose--hexose-1-phosphate uridylyltransferase